MKTTVERRKVTLAWTDYADLEECLARRKMRETYGFSRAKACRVYAALKRDGTHEAWLNYHDKLVLVATEDDTKVAQTEIDWAVMEKVVKEIVCMYARFRQYRDELVTDTLTRLWELAPMIPQAEDEQRKFVYTLAHRAYQDKIKELVREARHSHFDQMEDYGAFASAKYTGSGETAPYDLLDAKEQGLTGDQAEVAEIFAESRRRYFEGGKI